MEQKIIQIGNSVMITKRKKAITSSITPRFLGVLEKVNKEYDEALKELARR